MVLYEINIFIMLYDPYSIHALAQEVQSKTDLVELRFAHVASTPNVHY